MAKRIWNSEDPELFQFKEGGNLYIRIKDNDYSLDTKDLKQAKKNKEFFKATQKFFGAASFKGSMSTLFPQFLKEKKSKVRASTHAQYTYIWTKHFEPKLGGLKLVKLDQGAWDSYCQKTKSVKDFQNHRTLIHNFLKWCARKGLIFAVREFENPKHKNRRRKIIPPEHLTLLFQNAHGSLLIFLSMALFMGMRRGEIMKLSWDRVNLVKRSLFLREEDVKTDEPRELPLNSFATVLLTSRLRDQQEAGKQTPWVFPNAKSGRRHADVSGLKTAWKTCLKHSGLSDLKYTFHDLRATYEKHSNKSKDHTDTQREKMAGASIAVQKRRYITMDAEDLRGLEEVVQVPELVRILNHKTDALKVELGNGLGESEVKLTVDEATDGND